MNFNYIQNNHWTTPSLTINILLWRQAILTHRTEFIDCLYFSHAIQWIKSVRRIFYHSYFISALPNSPFLMKPKVYMNLDQSHCGKEGLYEPGSVSLWQRRFIWTWISLTVAKKAYMNLDQSHCGKEGLHEPGSVSLWQRRFTWTWISLTVAKKVYMNLDQSHCGKEGLHEPGSVSLWQRRFIWTWISLTVAKKAYMNLDQSHCGKEGLHEPGSISLW
jgi:hypothetical protein